MLIVHEETRTASFSIGNEMPEMNTPKENNRNVLCAQCGEIVDYGDATCAGDEATRYHICDDCMDEEAPDSYDCEEESIKYGVKEL